MTAPNRSPIKAPPLRLPGQSLTEERALLLEDKVVLPLLLIVLLIAMAGVEWWRFYFPSKPNPLVVTFLAMIGIVFFAWRIYGVRQDIRRLRQGIDGERAVGQFLESLREKKYKVFHDVVGDSFNIDHVLIGPAGVFTVETKTWSKPVRGDARVKFDGEYITVFNKERDRDPVIQAKAQATWLRALLKESTGREYLVRPVVVFPGWFVESTPVSRRNVWVLEPKALPAFLDQENALLSEEDIKLASFHLSRFLRVSETDRQRRKREIRSAEN
jgi:Nuclease-related domain